MVYTSALVENSTKLPRSFTQFTLALHNRKKRLCATQPMKVAEPGLQQLTAR
jgi:hypothetical protein